MSGKLPRNLTEALAHLKAIGMVPKAMWIHCQAAFREMRN